MNQKLTCAKNFFEKSCLLACRVYCDMELKHNLLVKQYCYNEMILCSKAHDNHGYHWKHSNENHSTFDYDVKKTCETNLVFDGLQDLRCIMAPDYYPDGSHYIFPTCWVWLTYSAIYSRIQRLSFVRTMIPNTTSSVCPSFGLWSQSQLLC
jgi:hypothetical protein